MADRPARLKKSANASAADFTAALIPFAGRAVTPLRSLVGFAAVVSTVSSPASLPCVRGGRPARMQKTLETPRACLPKRGLPLAMVWGALAGRGAALAGFLILWSLLRHEPDAGTGTGPISPGPVTVPARFRLRQPARGPGSGSGPGSSRDRNPPQPPRTKRTLKVHLDGPPGRPPGQRPRSTQARLAFKAADSRPPPP